ncbi:MAG: hypothetical protein Q7J11_01540 [Candidatus Roizmanbacteria bacterium]|nr:hypothetical protein [Candidatus Roizmanbacteria bacterium]
MNQTISLPASALEELLNRIGRLELIVFGKKTMDKFEDKIVLSERAKKRYKKMDKDLKQEKNIYAYKDSNEALRFLLSDKR